MVSLIIPTLHPPADLPTTVSQLAKYPQVSEIIVVANGVKLTLSSDKTRVIELKENRGFTGACNAGARAASQDLILFLNDDCTLSEKTLSLLCDHLVSQSDTVATQPIIKNGSGAIENIGFVVDTRVGKAHPITDPSYFSNFKFQISNSIYGLSATCLLMRKDVFEKVGMFDESFHSYLEDVDLAISLRKRGYNVSPCVTAFEVHKHMSTSKRMGNYKQKKDLQNWCRLVWKHREIFMNSASVVPLCIERLRNISGLLKTYLPRARR